MARVGKGKGMTDCFSFPSPSSVSKRVGCSSVGVVHEVRAYCAKIGLVYQLTKCDDNIPEERKGRREMHNTLLLFEHHEA